MSLSLKFEEDLISGCWEIPSLIFWGRLPFEVVFISGNFQFWFGPISLSLKFEEDPISGCWDIPIWIFCKIDGRVVGWLAGLLTGWLAHPSTLWDRIGLSYGPSVAKIPKIVDTTFHCNTKGQRTHFTWPTIWFWRLFWDCLRLFFILIW